MFMGSRPCALTELGKSDFLHLGFFIIRLTQREMPSTQRNVNRAVLRAVDAPTYLAFCVALVLCEHPFPHWGCQPKEKKVKNHQVA